MRELLIHCVECDRGFPVTDGMVVIIGFWKCDDCAVRLDRATKENNR